MVGMSKRIDPTLSYRKREGAGFVTEPFVGKVVEDDGFEPCLLCDDQECREWATFEAPDGGQAYHVSECQMEPVP